jgi:hypothetical protein
LLPLVRQLSADEGEEFGGEAYVLMQELRLSARGNECASVQVSTLRDPFPKPGVSVERSVRRIALHLPPSVPYLCDWLRFARWVGAVPA